MAEDRRNRLVPRLLGLVGMLAAFAAVHAVAVFFTGWGACPVNWEGVEPDDRISPGSPRYAFCEGEWAYGQQQHIYLWFVPLVALAALGLTWTWTRDARWLRTAWVVSGVTALVFYAPWWFLPT